MSDHEQTQLPPDEYLSSEEVRHLLGIIKERLNILTGNSRNAVSQLTEDRAQDADALDLATSESDRDFVLRIAGRERHMIGKMRNSLQRIEEGEYGMCETCGEAITYKRLLVRPVATQCIDCKTQAEQLERRDRSY
jgi:DnaK suppressor protein